MSISSPAYSTLVGDAAVPGMHTCVVHVWYMYRMYRIAAVLAMLSPSLRCIPDLRNAHAAVIMTITPPPPPARPPVHTSTRTRRLTVPVTELHCTAACEVCKASIEKARGKLAVKEAARAVSERDDRLLSDRLEALEAANREVRCAALHGLHGGGAGRGYAARTAMQS